jgi:hypothetical protein
MATRSELRNPNWLRAVLADAEQAAAVANAGLTIPREDVEARMREREAAWRAANPRDADRLSPHEIRLRLRDEFSRDLLRESRQRVAAAQERLRTARAAVAAAAAEARRLDVGVTLPADLVVTSGDRAILTALHTIVGQNARAEARAQLAGLGDRDLFASLQQFERDGDLQAAVVAEEALDGRLAAPVPEGPDALPVLEGRRALRRELDAHRDARLSAADRARLTAAHDAVTAIEQAVRGATDLQAASEHVGTLTVRS